MNLRIHAFKDGITKLGPGVRFGLWTQGCPRKCPGCMTPDSQPFNGGFEAEVDKIAEKIIASGRIGLTISGGEPFFQAAALTELIEKVKAVRDVGVIVYTGYTIEEINACNDPNYIKFLNECDLIIDGRYIDELNDGKNGRGSSNQRAIAITDRYNNFVSEFGTKSREVEFFYKEDSFSMVGIPSKEMLERLKKLK